MLSKPLSFLLVYLFSLLNFLIITLPFLFAFSPLLFFGSAGFLVASKDFVIFSLFVISSLMVLYLIFDLLFGISIRGMTKKSKGVNKMKKELPILERVASDFADLNKKFSVVNAQLLIAKSPEVNAYAIGSFRKNVVVLTIGILAHYKRKSQNMEEFYASIKGIMAHEFSHLANRDFLPGLLVFANEKSIAFMSRFLRYFFKIFASFFLIVPFFGRMIYNFVISLHRLTDIFLHLFYRFCFNPAYNFTKLHVSRATEYRCDKQAAEACGGEEMMKALDALGKSGFITIFSTHPATKSRVKYVAKVQQKKGRVRISILNKMSNILAIMFLLFMLRISYNHVVNLEYFSAEFYQNIYYEQIFNIKKKYHLLLKQFDSLVNYRF